MKKQRIKKIKKKQGQKVEVGRKLEKKAIGIKSEA